jgi:hypothetical protein
MAEQLYFARDSKMYVVFNNQAWEIPVLDGFSFSQAVNSSEISLSEMENIDKVSRRGTRRFTDALAPAEFSFSTYVRPFASAGGGNTTNGISDGQVGQVHALEEVFWAHLGGADQYDQVNGDWVRGVDQHPDHTGGEVGTAGANNTGSIFNFNQSNRAVLTTFDVYVVMETSDDFPMIYKLPEAVINEVTIDFDVDGIATLNWSGFAKEITDWRGKTTVDQDAAGIPGITNGPDSVAVAAGNLALATDQQKAFWYYNGSAWVKGYDEGVDDTTTFIRNRLTQLSLIAADRGTFGGQTFGISAIAVASTVGTITTTEAHGIAVGDTLVVDITGTAALNETVTVTGSNATELTYTSALADASEVTGSIVTGKYVVTLTGGNITFSNNINYLIPEELGKVNVPIEHITGARSVSGNFTCYLTLDDANNSGTSSDLFNDMTSTSGLGQVVNKFEAIFKVGGVVTNTPRLEVKMANTHIEVPVHQIEDVVAVETTFQGLPSTISDMDEMESITYKSRP